MKIVAAKTITRVIFHIRILYLIFHSLTLSHLGLVPTFNEPAFYEALNISQLCEFYKDATSGVKLFPTLSTLFYHSAVPIRFVSS